MNYLILEFRRYQYLRGLSGWYNMAMNLDFIAYRLPNSDLYNVYKDRTGSTFFGQNVTRQQLNKALEKLEDGWNKAQSSTTP